MNETILRKYAELVVKTGINLQDKQTLVISSPLECAPFARLLSETAFKAGARDVVINWLDDLSSKIRFLHAPDEVFDEFPEWRRDFYLSYLREGAAFVSISASDPELLKEVNPDRIVRAQKTSNIALTEYREKIMSHQNSWCVISVPTKPWAAKVFPAVSEDEAVDRLWDAIVKAVRADAANPVDAWNRHKTQLRERRDFLNASQFKLLHYKSANGTDLTVELPAGHIWMGGSKNNGKGVEFIANIPTEEVFTLPKKTGVNGTVFSSKPLAYNGNLIADFSLTFKDGKVVSFTAKQGKDILEKLLATDEGAAYLGEVALVPYDSPISNAKILFYNTLFDENASCHFAFGKAYPTCIQDGAKLSPEELASRGVNDSLVHVDFMVGTADLEITGIAADGRQVPVFKNGNFA
ncbi:MAG: aminopeptidase [Negativicutes bacterium]|nr:aminopeptidase [Negativicutes bacterium]